MILVAAGTGAGVVVGAAAGARSAGLLRRHRPDMTANRSRLGFVAGEVLLAIVCCGGLMALVAQFAVFGPEVKTQLVRLGAITALVGVSYVVARYDFKTQLTDEWATLVLGALATLYLAVTGIGEPVTAGLNLAPPLADVPKVIAPAWIIVLSGVVLWALVSGDLRKVELASARGRLGVAYRSWVRSILRGGGGFAIPVAAWLAFVLVPAWLLGGKHLQSLGDGLRFAVVVYSIGIAVSIVGSYLAKRPCLGQGDVTYLAVVSMVCGPILTFAVFLLMLPLGIMYGYTKRLIVMWRKKAVDGQQNETAEPGMALLPALSVAAVAVAAFPSYAVSLANWYLKTL